MIVTHGYEDVMVRWLREQGLQAGSFQTEYGSEDDAAPSATARESGGALGPTDPTDAAAGA